MLTTLNVPTGPSRDSNTMTPLSIHACIQCNNDIDNKAIDHERNNKAAD